MPFSLRRSVRAGGFTAFTCAAMLTGSAFAGEDVWSGLKQQTFGDRAIQAEDGVVTLDAPPTAEDAAIVPLTVRVPPSVKQKLKSLSCCYAGPP